MAHESHEGGFVGFEVVARVGGENVCRLTVVADHARVALGIGLDPLGGVVHLAVLPCAKPEENEAQVMLACAVDEGVYVGEVEVALRGLELFPVDGGFEGVGMQVGHGLKDLRQLAWPCARIVDLAAEHEEGFAIDEEGVAAVLVDDLRRLLGVNCREGEAGGECRNRKAVQDGSRHV